MDLGLEDDLDPRKRTEEIGGRSVAIEGHVVKDDILRSEGLYHPDLNFGISNVRRRCCGEME